MTVKYKLLTLSHKKSQFRDMVLNSAILTWEKEVSLYVARKLSFRPSRYFSSQNVQIINNFYQNVVRRSSQIQSWYLFALFNHSVTAMIVIRTFLNFWFICWTWFLLEFFIICFLIFLLKWFFRKSHFS